MEKELLLIFLPNSAKIIFRRFLNEVVGIFIFDQIDRFSKI